MRILLFTISILLKSCLLYSQHLNEECFFEYRKKVEIQIERDLKEELTKVENVKIIPFPMYEIKANMLGKIWLTLDTVNCFGILLRKNVVIGFAYKENNTPYKLFFFENYSSLKAEYPVENQSAIDTLIVADKKVAMDVSPLYNRLGVINPDSVQVVFGKGFTLNEKLSMALEYSENLCWIYSFAPFLDVGIGIVEDGKVSYLKFVYSTQPIVYNDIKSFFKSQYPTMKEYRRLKRFWNRK